jgi:hypothetical protein
MVFCSGNELGKMLLDELACEAWPCCEKIGVDGFDPGGRDWATGSLVQVLNDVLFSL